jgi:hypothetical protein
MRDIETIEGLGLDGRQESFKDPPRSGRNSLGVIAANQQLERR